MSPAGAGNPSGATVASTGTGTGVGPGMAGAPTGGVPVFHLVKRQVGFSITVNGTFGTDIRSKIRWLQVPEMKAPPTGVVDTATWAHLFNPSVTQPAGSRSRSIS